MKKTRYLASNPLPTGALRIHDEPMGRKGGEGPRRVEAQRLSGGGPTAGIGWEGERVNESRPHHHTCPRPVHLVGGGVVEEVLWLHKSMEFSEV